MSKTNEKIRDFVSYLKLNILSVDNLQKEFDKIPADSRNLELATMINVLKSSTTSRNDVIEMILELLENTK